MYAFTHILQLQCKLLVFVGVAILRFVPVSADRSFLCVRGETEEPELQLNSNSRSSEDQSHITGLEFRNSVET
jgi:hypothetical protein